VMGRRSTVFWSLLAAGGILLGANQWLAARYVTVEPGWVRPAASLVRVQGRQSRENLLYAVVRLRPAGVVDAVRAAFDPLVELIPAPGGSLNGPGWEEYGRQLEQDMDESRAVAVAVALRALGRRAGEEGLRVGEALLEPPGVDAGEAAVVGASAGLMMALEVYAQLHPAGVPARRRIAGTGQLDAGGAVHPVGGVSQKIAASAAAGADVFLIPRGNLDDVKNGGSLLIIPVDTFEDALAALRRLEAVED